MSAPASLMEHDDQTDVLYARHVNAQWVKLIRSLGMDKRFVFSQRATLQTQEGERYLDFLSGYGVYNVGHHHPYITEQLIDELQGFRPTMLQSYVPELAAELAERLSRLAGSGLNKVFFTSTGSEGVETVIKFARAFTKRDSILYAAGGFHGLTCGALSLMSNQWWREGFGPMLADTKAVPFNDLEALEQELKSKRYAAFVTEPIQGESGVVVPEERYLQEASKLCRRYGTLLVLDEVQTGIYRTGKFLAAQHFDVAPDMVVLAKAMSGGQIPVGAVLMRDDINTSVFSSVPRAFIHASTFGENALAMRACLATLDVIENEGLAERAITQGIRLRSGLSALVGKFEMLREVRGLGMFNAIEFQPPRTTTLKLLFNGFIKAHPGLFGQMVVKSLFEEQKILTQMCGNNYMVIKAIPPLVVSDEEIDRFIEGFASVLDTIENHKTRFWSQGLSIAKRALS